MRIRYPNMQIVMVDDSRPTTNITLPPSAQYYTVSPNTGISVCILIITPSSNS